MLPSASVWPPRIAALVLSTAAALSAVYWGLHWRVPVSPEFAGVATPTSQHPINSAAVARALGASRTDSAAAPNTSSTPEAASRFALRGVLGNGESGSALISVDGKPAKPVRVGAIVVDGWSLRQASGRRALLAEGHTVVELTLPAPPAPNTTPSSVAGNPSKKSP